MEGEWRRNVLLRGPIHPSPPLTMEKSANEDGKSKSTRSFFPIYGKTKQSVLSISFDSSSFLSGEVY
jgi:hypothetical protein